MPQPPPLFRYRPRAHQILLGGVVPFVFGAVVGVVLGISGPAFWALSALAGLGGVLAGFEHPDGWGGADRGLVGGAIFGLGVLIGHTIAGTTAKVSLGSFPPFVIVIDAIFGMFLGALGGRIGRSVFVREPVTEQASGPGVEPVTEQATGSGVEPVAEQTTATGVEPHT
jgi:hypothetical protein